MPCLPWAKMSTSSAPAASSATAPTPIGGPSEDDEGGVTLRGPVVPPTEIIPGYACVGELSNIPEGLSRFVLPAAASAAATGAAPAGEPLCIVRQGDAITALHNVCPHKAADMHLGDIVVVDVEEAASGKVGACVRCPRHRKRWGAEGMNFRCNDGSSWVKDPTVDDYDPAWQLPVYGVRRAGGYVWVSAAPVSGRIQTPGGKKKKGEKGGDKGAMAMENTGAEAGAVNVTSTTTTVAATATTAALVGSEVDASWLPASITHIVRVSHDSLLYTLQTSAAPDTSACDKHSWHVSLALDDPHNALSATAAAAVATTTTTTTTPATSHTASNPLASAPASASSSSSTTAINVMAVASTLLSREYTPVSPLAAWSEEATLQLLVKIYPTGKLTSRLGQLKEGARVWVSQPVTTLSTPQLLQPSAARATAAAAAAAPAPGSALALIAGGTGITPMLQLARWALAPQHAAVAPSRVYLLTSQHGSEDMLCRADIASLAAAAGGRLRVLHTLTRAAAAPAALPEEGEHVQRTVGRVNAGMLSTFLPLLAANQSASAGADPAAAAVPTPPLQRVILSGPTGMMEAVSAELASLGYPLDKVVELEA